MLNAMFLARAARWAACAGRYLRNTSANASVGGSGLIQVGERWIMVTCAAVLASSGTSVTAVAPDPITAIRLPA